MGHRLHAVISSCKLIAEFAGRWHWARFVQLPQDFALIPLTAELYEDIVELAAIEEPDPHPGFARLSSGVASVLADFSRHGPVAYVVTDYFGGVGSQQAIAWRNGEFWIGPFHSQTKRDGSGSTTAPAGERAINQVLKGMGAWTCDEKDLFDALNLGKFRDTDTAGQKRIS